MVSVSLVYKTIMISCDICEQFLSFFFFLPALAELPDYVNFEGEKKKARSTTAFLSIRATEQVQLREIFINKQIY